MLMRSKMQLIYYAASTVRARRNQSTESRTLDAALGPCMTDSRQQVPIRESYETPLHSRTKVTNWPRGEIWRMEISFVRAAGIKFYKSSTAFPLDMDGFLVGVEQ
jgi:hypothetical protein